MMKVYSGGRAGGSEVTPPPRVAHWRRPTSGHGAPPKPATKRQARVAGMAALGHVAPGRRP